MNVQIKKKLQDAGQDPAELENALQNEELTPEALEKISGGATIIIDFDAGDRICPYCGKDCGDSWSLLHHLFNDCIEVEQGFNPVN